MAVAAPGNFSRQFYLNISPDGTNRELHAAQGTGGGADADPPMADAQAVKALGDMLVKLKENIPPLLLRRLLHHPSAIRN